MKIIAQTKRGKFYVKEKESGEERFALIADWQFFRGLIHPKEELNFDDLKKGFNNALLSINQGNPWQKFLHLKSYLSSDDLISHK